MYVRQVVIKNFRNIKYLSLALSNGLNVIVGENNVGKTNLIDALRVALGSAAATGDPVRLNSDDLHRDQSGHRTEEAIHIALTFSALSHEERAQCLEILNYDPAAPEQSTASINFSWSWSEKSKRWHMKRWAGDRPDAEASVPDDILQSIPVTLLSAMRDALNALLPGRQSRLGRLLAASASESDKTDLEAVVLEANKNLQKSALLSSVETRIQNTLTRASGTELSQKTGIRTSEPRFERIVNNLRLVLRLAFPGHEVEEKTEELHSNGLGYNNLLYIGTVLAELEITRESLLALLLVEEPEAHLHPQLQTLLADFLAATHSEKPTIQTIVTTHSPTIAAHVQPEAIHVLHANKSGGRSCFCLGNCGLTEQESNRLRRLFDVTKATLLFSRGVILVEGVSEALILPVLARRLNTPLENAAISVVPVHGLEFKTLAKLFGQNKIEMPVSILTDGDPLILKNPNGSGDEPKGHSEDNVLPGDRVLDLQKCFEGNAFIRVFNSEVTLEYDLAKSGPNNPELICSAWESLYGVTPRTFNRKLLDECGDDHKKRALTVWRGICQSAPSRTKAEFAQELAAVLDERDPSGEYIVGGEQFIVPDYIRLALQHVIAG